jgi:N,N'-diacetylchitobiose transport system substrate-binding protein
VKRKLIAATAAAAVVALTASACSSSKPAAASGNANGLTGPTANAAGTTLDVWLVSDPENNPAWMAVINDATKAFTAKTGATVKINWQTWGNHLTALTAALQGNNQVPDVVELGNTEAAKYSFNGALADVSSVKSGFDNNDTWLTGLSAPCEVDGKLYCIPYYAGTRAMIYRTDLLASAGIKTLPTTQADFLTDLDTVKAANASNPNFVTFDMPGEDWYEAMSFVYGAGGSIATQTGGKWAGNLESAASETGLNTWASMVSKYSTSTSYTKNEADEDTLYETGNVFVEYDAAWHQGAVQTVLSNPNDPKSAPENTPVNGKVAVAPLPGLTAGVPSPAFLGGSVLGITQKSKNQNLAAEWVQEYTNSQSELGLAAVGNLPNNTAQLAQVSGTPAISAQIADQAKASWFTPVSPNWANVESQNILQNMLESIATQKATVDAAAKTADAQIAAILNKSS